MESRDQAAIEHADGRQLMLAVVDGVPGAFDRLVARYRSYIACQVGRYVRDRSSIEDLTQEVLLRVYCARSRYEASARFEAYLRCIILNLCMNHARYTRRRRATSLNDVGPDGSSLGDDLTDHAAASPAQETVRREQAMLVRDAVARLPAGQRRVIVLASFNGLDNTEVAHSVGLSQAAVKSLLWRGRENLARYLGPARIAAGCSSSRRAAVA